MITKSLSNLAAEIDALVVTLGGILPSPAVDRLEKEIAFLAWRLKMRRMSRLETAIYYNGLVRQRPVYNLHTRIEDLIEELKLW